MVKFTRAVRNGKMVAIVEADETPNLVTTRQKRTTFQTRKERQYVKFMEAVGFNWQRYGGGAEVTAGGEIAWNKTHDEGL